MAKKEQKQQNDPVQESQTAENVCEQPESEAQQAAQNAGEQAQAAYQLTQEQFDELKKRIEGLQKEKEEYIALAQRVQADFDNFRRRNNAARAESYDDGMRETVKALLPALDNLERALKAAEDAGETGSIVEGVRMVCRQFEDGLSRLGVEVIETKDQAFDPEIHNAVLSEPVEGTETGTILEEFQKGYRHKDKVIRHSMVKVAQ